MGRNRHGVVLSAAPESPIVSVTAEDSQALAPPGPPTEAASASGSVAEVEVPAEEPEDDDPDPSDARAVRDARDRRLVRKLKQGDERAFQELVHTYQDRIFGLMYRMIGNRQEAEDLAQEVFISVHRGIANYRGEGRFYTWLYRIASNTCKNRLKYLKGRNFHRSSDIDETPEAHMAGADGPTVHLQSIVPGPEATITGSRLEAAIQREIAALDPEHRLLIVLRDIQGMSYADIRRVTGLQEGTLKSRLHRARLALKERLQPYLE